MRRTAQFTTAEIRRAMRAAKAEGVRAILRPDGKLEIDPEQRPAASGPTNKGPTAQDFHL